MDGSSLMNQVDVEKTSNDHFKMEGCIISGRTPWLDEFCHIVGITFSFLITVGFSS
jgi:hypothetical protein